MPINLAEEVSAVFTRELVRKAAYSLGEHESNVTKAFGAGIPSFLFGIIKKAGDDCGSNLLLLAKQTARIEMADNGDDVFNSSGVNVLPELLGTWQNGITNLISNFARVKPASSKSILIAIAPIALGLIGRHALNNNLSAGGILRWLTGQLQEIARSLPEGFSLSGLLSGPQEFIAEEVHPPVTLASPFEAVNSRLWPILILLCGLGLFWYLLKHFPD